MKNFDYLEPRTVAEACAMLKQHAGEAKVFAGGAHVTILMKQGLYQPKALVNIKKIAELKNISFDTTEGLTIGALVTHREIETSSLVNEKLPVLSEAEREIANIRVRNMGTVGGNLASGEPLTDLSQIFIALDGKVKIAGPSGQRTILVEELFLDFYTTSLAEDEIITQIVLGCVGPTPVRAKSAEALVTGKILNADLMREAGALASQECSPIGDLRGSEEYKRAIVRTLVKRATDAAYKKALSV